MRFMHIADIHLGNQQYGLKERYNDFTRAFIYLIDVALKQSVDCVLLSGDLFDRQAVDPLAMRIAIEGFQRLRDARIPVVAVEGNHERATYRDQYSWVDFLDALGYLHLLNYDPRSGLQPYGDEGGAYIDLDCGMRVYGIRYYGAATGRVLSRLADALDQQDNGDMPYAVLLAHTGLEGEMAHVRGCDYGEFAPLRECIDYVALGHFHKPFEEEEWIYNPGSPETCAMDEVAWPKRGYYMVEVPTEATVKHRAELHAVPRRPFHRFVLPVDSHPEPAAVYDAVRALIHREDGRVSREPRPVIALTLSGVLPFSRFDLDLAYIQDLLAEAWHPLGRPHVADRTTPAEFEVALDLEVGRAELEQQVIRQLLERDSRFRAAAEDWAKGAIDLKHLVLSGSSPEAVVTHLRRLRTAMESSVQDQDTTEED